MWGLHLPRLYRSAYNGLIFVSPCGEVWVGGAKQTSKHYGAMWSDALARASELLRRNGEHVLMLGLAGGGMLPALHAAYPHCTITAVEIDPSMVIIARTLNSDAPYPFPRVIVGDAHKVLQHLDERFDIICIDIFSGIHPSSHVDNDAFWHIVRTHLMPGGVVLLNVALSSTKRYTAQKHFKHSRAWQYGGNTFCALSD